MPRAALATAEGLHRQALGAGAGRSSKPCRPIRRKATREPCADPPADPLPDCSGVTLAAPVGDAMRQEGQAPSDARSGTDAAGVTG